MRSRSSSSSPSASPAVSGGSPGAVAHLGESVGELELQGGAVRQAGEGVGEGLAPQGLLGTRLAVRRLESPHEQGQHEEAGEHAGDQHGP